MRGSSGLLRALVAFGALALGAGCAHDDRAGAGNGAARPSGLQTQAPLSASGGAREEPTGAPVVVESASAAPQTSPEVAPSGAGPQILALTESPAVVHAGESVAFSATTSPDVATVTAKVSMYTLPFVRTAPGRFALSFAIPPNVPGFFHGTYSMAVVASGKGGSSVSRSLEITFQ